MFGTLSLSKLRAPALLCVAGAVVGAGLGLAGRKIHATAARAEAARSSLTSKIPPARSALRGVPGSSAAQAEARAIAAALASDKGVEYWLHLLAAADTAPADVLARLVDSLNDEPSARSLLGARWAQLDPEGMFAALEAREPENNPESSSPAVDRLWSILVAEWFSQNPDALIQALNTVGGVRRLMPAKEEVFRLLSPKDPSRSLRLLVDWELPYRIVENKVLTPWLRAHPREAMELILARTGGAWWAGDGGSDILRETAEGMAETDPVAALSLPAAPNRNQQQAFVQYVMKAWAGRDLAAAVAWLAGDQVDQKKRNDLSQSLLEIWSAKDAPAATAWADVHVTGRARISANYALIPALASQDSAGALEFVSQMNPGFNRDEAVHLLTDSLLTDKGKDEAWANFQRITALSDPALRKAALEHSAWKMMKAAPREFLDWLATPAGADASFRTFTATANHWAEKDADAAMKWAAGLRGDITAEVRQIVLHKWLWTKPDSAQAWVSSLPAGEERSTSVTNAAGILAGQVSVEKYTSWLDSLPASDHPAILAGLEKASGLDPGVKADLTAKYK